MGQESSAANGHTEPGQDTTAGAKRCYYEVLEVERDANDEELKKAYRKKALQFHPDRNYGQEEEATAQFAHVQAAYEVLADPQERAWYDSHRDAILRGTDGQHMQQDSHVTGVTSEDLLKFFDPSIFSRMDDSEYGFYTRAGQIFAKLAEDEEMLGSEDSDMMDYPAFGNSKLTYEQGVRDFYAIWGGFSTAKTFSWLDGYNYRDAPDRRIKRAMEKENRKARDVGRKEYNDTVRSFISFIKKRDARFKAGAPSTAQRQAEALAASKAQAAKDRAAFSQNLNDYVEPEWMQARDETDSAASTENDEPPLDLYECVVCSKSFKTESQFKEHEKSKKHKKAEHLLRRQMRKEDVSLGLHKLDDSSSPIPDSPYQQTNDKRDISPMSTPPNGQAHDRIPESGPNENAAEGTESGQGQKGDGDRSLDSAKRVEANNELEIPSEDEYRPPAEFEKRLNLQETPSEYRPPSPKLGKAKQKKLKKQAASATQSYNCNTCDTMYASRSKLFQHLEDNPTHALMKSAGKRSNR